LNRSVYDIDLFPAGLAEYPLPGAAVGPTFTCIIGIQMYNIKYGDRFWFEHGGQAGSLSPGKHTRVAHFCDFRNFLCKLKLIKIQL